ncbi:PQQ-binding-like beta-propeller repeat protein [Geodermatophilus sp. CPCC 206100]|uniref:outer membrane protein assembly factor BamB family protein n=1 Tax=Geodermatophilus sp. CPCC 206100 TaxID=3020054 RepID=UPI003B00C835
MRRPTLRGWIWTAATLALVVVAALLWRGSDAAATRSTTADPAGVPAGTPAGAVSTSWSASTTTAGGTARPAVHGGRVVVADGHGVRALDVATGETAWQYTRANARLCDWTLAGSVVVAVSGTEDRCDEAVALSTDTGVRSWTRNVDFRADVTLTSTDRIVLAASPTGVVTLDPVGDNTRWRQPAGEGCRIVGADVGEAGVVVLQRCAGSAALQLRLFDGFQGGALWSRDVPEGTTLAGVGPTVVVAGTDGVQLLAAADGAPLGSPLPGATAQVTAIGDTALVLADGLLSAVDQAGGAVRWQVPATGLPAAATTRKLPAPAATVPVPEAGAIVLRDVDSGQEQGRVTGADLPDGALVTVVGPVVVAQEPDRVVAAR